MKGINKIVLWLLVPIFIAYLFICAFLYFTQEKIIFRPTQLADNYTFKFDQPFEEVNIACGNGISLNALHFKSDFSKGLVLYFHGNGGALDTWGKTYDAYTSLGYDLLIVDYRGYGKSKGKYCNQKQFFKDTDSVYSYAERFYDASKIVVVGYSLGTAPAARIASKHPVKRLMLLSTYYSIADIMQYTYPFIPTNILKYKFKTFDFIDRTDVPITIFQGLEDNEDFLNSSSKLKSHLKKTDQFIQLKNQGHNGIDFNPEYQQQLRGLLGN